MQDVDELKGQELAGVAFVRDYVELLFDGPILRCYAPPEVVTGRNSVVFPDSGSRDALCALIGAEVMSVRRTEVSLSLEFGAERYVHLDFTREWDEGREAAEFVPLLDGRLAPDAKYVW